MCLCRAITRMYFVYQNSRRLAKDIMSDCLLPYLNQNNVVCNNKGSMHQYVCTVHFVL